jgi:predicted nucleic acid-binding protein
MARRTIWTPTFSSSGTCSAESRALLQAVEQGRREAYMTSFSLHSVEVILDRLQKQATLERFLLRVAAAQGLTVYPTSVEEEQAAVGVTRKFPLDFDDALQYHVCATLGLTLVSFDRDFDSTDIKRKEPSQLI